MSFLELKEPRINWKMIEFLSNKPTTSLLLAFISRMAHSGLSESDADVNEDGAGFDHDVDIDREAYTAPSRLTEYLKPVHKGSRWVPSATTSVGAGRIPTSI